MGSAKKIFDPLLVAAAKAVRKRLSEHVDTTEPLRVDSSWTGGDYCNIGRTVVADLRVEIWRDRYLNADAEPRFSSWLFSYSREGIQRVTEACRWKRMPDRAARDRTKGSVQTLRDAPGESAVGHAFVDSWGAAGGYYFGRYIKPKAGAAVVEQLVRDIEALAALASEVPDPRVMALVRRRQGQQPFRRALMAEYGPRCAVSGCEVLDLLEAAHIVPYRKGDGYRTSNGILLRADLHTLFDTELLTIRPNGVVSMAPHVADFRDYARFRSHPVTVTLTKGQRASLALRAQGR